MKSKLNKPFNDANQSAGFALTEAMISLFLIGLGLSMTITKISDVKSVQTRLKALASISQLGSNISSSAVNLAVLMNSLNHPQKNIIALKGCLQDAGSCIQGPSSKISVNLYSMGGEQKTGIKVDAKGNNCSMKPNFCAYEIKSVLTPLCGIKSGKKKCSIAQSVTIDISMQPIKKYWDKILGNSNLAGVLISRDVNVSLKSFANSVEGQSCPEDINLRNQFLDRRSTLQNKSEQTSDYVQSQDNWTSSDRFRKYFRGISWEEI